jgi:hypothetical protein
MALQVIHAFFFFVTISIHHHAMLSNWDALREINSMGFEVGLHYETDFFEQRGLDPLQGILKDVSALEAILNIKISSVSQHRPASSTLLKHLNDYYVDAYNYNLTHNVIYISDSGFKWRGKSLMDLLGSANRIHALIHPLTWAFGDSDMAATYHRISLEAEQEIHASFEDFIASTNRYLVERAERDRARMNLYQS